MTSLRILAAIACFYSPAYAYASCTTAVTTLAGEKGARYVLDNSELVGIATVSSGSTFGKLLSILTPIILIKGEVDHDLLVEPQKLANGDIVVGGTPPQNWSDGVAFYALKYNPDKSLYQHECVTRILNGPNRSSIMKSILSQFRPSA